MPRHLVLATIAAALLTVGCGRGNWDAVPANVPGHYIYAAKGSTFKKPWEFSALLDLTPDKRFKLTVDKTIEGHKDPTETATGTYTVSGDRIELKEGSGPLESTQDLHKLVIKADSLIAETGWTVDLILKGVGAPNIVFVRHNLS